MPREHLDHRVGGGGGGGGVVRNKRPPLIKTAGTGCCLMLDPHYSSSSMYLGDEGTYVCKAFSPRSYVIQKVAGFFLDFLVDFLSRCLVRGCCRPGLWTGRKGTTTDQYAVAGEGRAMSGRWVAKIG